MSDETSGKTPTNEELLKMIASMQQLQAPAQEGQSGRRRGQTPAVQINSIAIPVMIKDGGEKIRTFVFIDGSGISSDQDIIRIADQLADQGFSVEFWKEQQQRSGRGGNNGGGYNRGGGRY